jgi:hypothetical protein
MTINDNKFDEIYTYNIFGVILVKYIYIHINT